MKTPTQSDRAEFAAFCRDASDSQIIEIWRKEAAANRRVYAEIARAEMEKRGLD